MKDRKILVVYNTCGIRGDNTNWYIECLESILNQNFSGFRVVLSSCLNSKECIAEIVKKFRNTISYCIHSEPHTVNMTFNKAVQDTVAEFGEFESYIYVDSGCSFDDNVNILSNLYETYKQTNAEMIAVQSDTDEALQALDSKFSYESSEVQIKNENYVIPVGKAINLHVQLFGQKLFNAFNKKIIPDVFAAYCTESTFSFLTASVKSKWIILKDIQVRHLKGIDGASSSQPHGSPIYGNPWNNLLYGRDATNFIKDPDAIECGLGYEECNNIMIHRKEAYDESGYSLYPDKLQENINKHFFLSKEEINYEDIKSLFVP
jgi:hypothetical protein